MEAIDTFLRRIGQERFIEVFVENELDLDLLKDLSVDELKETLKELNLPLGPRLKILKGVQSLNVEGEWKMIFIIIMKTVKTVKTQFHFIGDVLNIRSKYCSTEIRA